MLRKWQTYLTTHLAGIDPLGNGYAAREKVFKAYMNYFKAPPDDRSHLLKDHHRVLTEAGISETDYAKQAGIFTIASFPNSAPTLYWTIYELFSRPGILAEVRREVEEQAVSRSREHVF
ncbi:MAG: hypothetical protein Q9214_004383, partial [Letrouitia sp. 1 TL-2023]